MQIPVRAHLLLDQAVAHRALLALVRGPVLEIVQLTFVTLIAHEPLATAAGAVVVTLHGNRAHWVTVTGWERTEHKGRGVKVILGRVKRGRGRRAESRTSATPRREPKESQPAGVAQRPLHPCAAHTLARGGMARLGGGANRIALASVEREGTE